MVKLILSNAEINVSREIKKPIKTVKLETGRIELKLTNYKPKLNERAVGVGVSASYVRFG